MDTNLAYTTDGTFDSLAPEPALPTQFQDIWSRSHVTGPEPRLALAVLQLAVVDLLKHASAPGAEGRRLYRKARAWISSTDRAWPYSFLNLCESIQIDPIRLRDQVLRGGVRDPHKALREVGKLLDIGRH